MLCAGGFFGIKLESTSDKGDRYIKAVEMYVPLLILNFLKNVYFKKLKINYKVYRENNFSKFVVISNKT